MVVGQVSKMVGAAVKRKEDPRLIAGAGSFTDDIQPRGTAYMEVLRSTHAHARIRRVDTSAAIQHPGVLAVLTGQEVNQTCKTPFPLFALMDGMRVVDRWPMATEMASFLGEPLAVVAATSAGAARDALALIQVDYEPLAAVVDMEGAAEAVETPQGGLNLVVEPLKGVECGEEGL